MHQALYRAWRPARFDDVVEQTATVQTLRRQAQTRRVAHAYLFSGSRGTGKTTMARLFARAINCESAQDGDACGVCPTCTALAQENLDIIEIDAASNNGVDEIRELRDRVKYPPQIGRYKVYIIDEVHMLTPAAFNALLKTLEEPPEHAVFILATTEAHKLPATVLSRCQRYDFHRFSMAGLVGRLRLMTDAMGVEADEEALRLIARAAEGGMRDAQSLLEVCLGYAPEALTAQATMQVLGVSGQAFLAEVAQALLDGDAARVFACIDRLAREGRDAAVFLRDMTAYARGLVVALAVEDCAELLSLTAEEAQAMRAQAMRVGPERALHWMTIMAQADGALRWAAQPRLLVELCLMQACRPETDDGGAALSARVARLEDAVARGALSAPAAAPAARAADKLKPAAVPRAVPAAQSPSGPPDEAGLWQALLAAVKNEYGMSKYVLLQKGKPRALTDGALSVWFTKADSIYHQSVCKDENQRMADALLSRVAGKPMKAEFQLEGVSAPVDNTPHNATVPDLNRPPSVADMAIALFGAENVTVEDS